MIEAQNYECALSGVELTPQTASADHIVPLSQGGRNVMDNVQIVHADMNRMKGTMSQDEFVNWCCLVSSHVNG